MGESNTKVDTAEKGISDLVARYKEITHNLVQRCEKKIKKNEILPLATTQMDLEGIKLSEISQTDKDTYHVILLTYVIVKKQNK